MKCIALTKGNRRVNGMFDPYIGYCKACRWSVAGHVDRVDEAVERHNRGIKT